MTSVEKFHSNGNKKFQKKITYVCRPCTPDKSPRLTTDEDMLVFLPELLGKGFISISLKERPTFAIPPNDFPRSIEGGDLHNGSS